jgi:hypothetical protein
MTDFIQLAPDRTAELSFSGGVAGITVSGVSGRNELANISHVPSLTPLADVVSGAGGGNLVGRAGAGLVDRAAVPAGPAPNTTMRAPNANNFHVVWTGSLALPAGTQAGSHRILITESETYLRTDIVPGDPNVSTSPLDFVRERVVYADVFEL